MAANPTTSTDTTAIDTVVQFLDALAASDIGAAAALLDDDVRYTNVGLPTIRGRREVQRAFDAFARRGQFLYVNHHIGVDADDPGVVLTERTDALVFGALHCQLWVWGRFEVREGQITVWRDSFDVLDSLKGLVRGIAGIWIPGAARHMPSV